MCVYHSLLVRGFRLGGSLHFPCGWLSPVEVVHAAPSALSMDSISVAQSMISSGGLNISACVPELTYTPAQTLLNLYNAPYSTPQRVKGLCSSVAAEEESGRDVWNCAT